MSEEGRSTIKFLDPQSGSIVGSLAASPPGLGNYGEKILPDYYNQNITIWNKVAVTERSIKNVEVEGVPIKGNLDKVEFNGKLARRSLTFRGSRAYSSPIILRSPPNG